MALKRDFTILFCVSQLGLLQASTTPATSGDNGLNEVEVIILACVGSALGVVIFIALACYCAREKGDKPDQRQRPNRNPTSGTGNNQGAINYSADLVDDSPSGSQMTADANSFQNHRNSPPQRSSQRNSNLSTTEEILDPRELQPSLIFPKINELPPPDSPEFTHL